MSNTTVSENTKVSTENVSVTNNESLECVKQKFSRDIVNKLGKRVQLTDKNEIFNLELFCYVKCSPEDDDIIHQCRGVVFHEDEIVMHAFPYTVEFPHTEKSEIENNISPIFKDCFFYDAYEGALIRMFNFSGKWFISTHRKLDAFRSKWSSKESFGESFICALESEIKHNEKLRAAIANTEESLLTNFQCTLDPKKQYMFLICHNEENRIVSSPPCRPTLFHVGTFVEGELVMTEDINIPYPKKHNFENIDELVNYVDRIDIRELQGVIVFAPNNKQYKVLHKIYQDFFKARGNQPSIKFRYLQVRMDKQMCDMLYYLYPNMIPTFEKYENMLYEIAKNNLKSYINRFINKVYVIPPLPKEEYRVIRECHSWHVQNRKENRISLSKVIEVMNQQHPTVLNQMIRRFHHNAELGRKEDEKTRTN